MPNTKDLDRTLFIADNLPILRGLDSESVDLIATARVMDGRKERGCPKESPTKTRC